MRRFWAACALAALVGCAAGTKAGGPLPEPVPTPTSVAAPEPSPSPSPATAVRVSPEQLAGGWGRPMPRGPGREGLALRPDGSLGLLGIFSMDGVTWRVDGDDLILSMSTERYPEAQEVRLHIGEAAPARLVLAGPDYLGGQWERRDFASATGTVTYRQRIAMTPEAVVKIELRDVSAEDGDSPLIAARVVRPAGRQVPIEYTLDYDPADIVPGRTYAVSARIVDRGQLQFVTDKPVFAIPPGAPAPLEILVVPVR